MERRQQAKIVVAKIFAVIIFIIGLAGFVCCAKHYTPEYSTEICELKIQDKNASDAVILNKIYKNEDVSFYFGSDITDVKTIDFLIGNSIQSQKLLKNNGLIKKEFSVIITDNLVSDCWVDENFGLCVSLPTKTSSEEITSWFLCAQNGASDLPFGIYAGISAKLLNLPSGEDFSTRSIGKDSCYIDLQFPLYETDNLSESERKAAFGFAKQLIEELSAEGKTYTDILSMNKNELNLYLSDKYDFRLPDYSFEPYSKKYEYKVKQGCFTYYINKEFNDLILPAEVFSAKYNLLTDWLKDNDKTTRESDKVFRVGNMYEIKVYLDDGLKSRGITGYANGDYIDMYSVGSFSHEYIHHILFYLGKNGFAREIIPEMHANTSKYARVMWYYLFTGAAERFPYNKEVKEKETYSETLKLYKKYSTEELTEDNFDFWLFADCFSAIYTEKGTTFIHRAQTDSLAYYISRVYGADYVWRLNMNTDIVIDGKPYLDVVDEWYYYIKSLNI